MTKKLTVELDVWDQITPDEEQAIKEIFKNPLTIKSFKGKMVMAYVSLEGFTYDFEIAEYLKNTTNKERQSLLVLSKINAKKKDIALLEVQLENIDDKS